MGQLAENGPTQHVYANPLDAPGRGAQFITPQGDPILPSSVEAELARRWPQLRIEWVGGAWGQSYFALKRQWDQNDKRWERVRSGECSPNLTFDLVHRFPREMPTDQMISWIEHNSGERAAPSDPRKEAERIIAEQMRKLEQLNAAQTDEIVETSTQRYLDDTPHQREVRAGAAEAHPMVSGADLTSPTVEREPKRLLEVAAK